MPESVRALFLDDAYADGVGLKIATRVTPAPAAKRRGAGHPIRERSMRVVRDYVARAAKAAAEKHPEITADVLRRCEEDGLTTHQAAEELGVSRSVLMKVRYHYGLVKRRSKRPEAPAETAAADPAPPPAVELKAEGFPALRLSPFELRQRGRFNATKLARILRGHANMLDAQDGEFAVELRIGQPGGLDVDLVTVEQVVNPTRLTDEQLADVINRIREVAGISVQSPVMADQPAPPEGDDAA